MYSNIGPYKLSIEYSGMVHETITSMYYYCACAGV